VVVLLAPLAVVVFHCGGLGESDSQGLWGVAMYAFLFFVVVLPPYLYMGYHLGL
jgi:hypothetical protein